MKKYTLGILGNKFDLTTEFVNKIILNTKADCDQEHIKMNIIINNKLLIDKKEILKIIKKLEDINTNYLILTFNDKEIYNFIKNNTNIKILNNNFNINDINLIESILKIFNEE